MQVIRCLFARREKKLRVILILSFCGLHGELLISAVESRHSDRGLCHSSDPSSSISSRTLLTKVTFYAMGTEVFAVDVSELSRVVSPLQLEMILYVPPDHSSKVPLESGLSMCIALSNVSGRSASSVSMLRVGDRCVFLESRRLRVRLDDKEDYSVTTKNSLLSYFECLDLSSGTSVVSEAKWSINRFFMFQSMRSWCRKFFSTKVYRCSFVIRFRKGEITLL